MKQLLTLLAAVLLTATTYAQVGINTENPDPSSALDINSTTGGLLTPRMTNQERLDIQDPAVGLLVYQTDGTAGFYYHNGTSWAAVSGSGGSDTNWLDDGTGNISNSNTGSVNVNSVLNANGGIVNSDITASSSLFATSTGTTTLGGGAVDVSALGATTTIKGDLVVDGSFTGDVTATSVENGVYTIGGQTIAGTKNFTDDLFSTGDFWNEGIMHSFGEIRSFDTINSYGVLNANGGIVNSDITASSSLFATSTGTTTLGGGAVDVSALGATTTIKGDLVVDGSFTGDVTATSVENGVYTIGDQTIAGTKTFSDDLISMDMLRSDGVLENNGLLISPGTINSMGNFYGQTLHANEYITTSDRRLKNNIKPMTKAIDKVMALNPVSYNKKKSISDSEYVIQENGFIAQELQKVMPKLVKVGTDKDKTLSVNYSGIIPVLTKAIQEQQKEIEELKQLVKKLLSSK